MWTQTGTKSGRKYDSIQISPLDYVSLPNFEDTAACASPPKPALRANHVKGGERPGRSSLRSAMNNIGQHRSQILAGPDIKDESAVRRPLELPTEREITMRRFFAILTAIGLMTAAVGCCCTTGVCDCDNGCGGCGASAPAHAEPPTIKPDSAKPMPKANL